MGSWELERDIYRHVISPISIICIYFLWGRKLKLLNLLDFHANNIQKFVDISISIPKK